MKRILIYLFLFLSCSVYCNPAGTWVDLNINISIQPLNSVYAVSNSIVWAGGDLGTVIYTNNEGASWSNRGGGQLATFSIFAISAIDSQTVLCAAHSQNPALTIIFKTTNAGQQWIATFVQQSGWIEDIKMVNATTGYAYGDPVGGRWTLLRTSTGGSTWDSTGMYLPDNTGNFGWFNAMFVYNPGVSAPIIWFGTHNSKVYRSTNGGFNWSAENIPAGDIFSIAFADGNAGFCGSNNMICGTTNGGSGWTLLPNLPGSGQVNSFVYNSGFYWYAREQEIYFSSNSGANFTLQHTSPGTAVYQHMSFAYSATNNTLSTIGGWAITGEIVISHYRDSNIGIHQIGTEIPKDFSLMQNYPNPFNPSTKIKFNIPFVGTAPGIVRLSIFDVLGNEVAILVKQDLKPGMYETAFDASAYSSGIYFYKLTAGVFSQTRKMIVLK